MIQAHKQLRCEQVQLLEQKRFAFDLPRALHSPDHQKGARPYLLDKLQGEQLSKKWNACSSRHRVAGALVVVSQALRMPRCFIQ